MLLQDDPSTEISKEIYWNISKSGFYRATTKLLILPCLDVIKWLSGKVDHQSRTILKFEGKHVVSYQPSMLHRMYHLKKPMFKVTQEWLQSKVEGAYYLA